MKLLTTVLFSILVMAAFGQEITVQGDVIDALTRKHIKSTIRYKSYPTGGISGRSSDSTFSFTIFGSSKYQVTADAEGYIPQTIIVDPKEAVSNVIDRDISLTSTGRAIRLDHLIFEMGRAVINPKSYASLDEVVAMMKDNTKVVIQLEGHTDNIGNAEKNMELSRDRVEAVKKYLTSKGVSKDRVKTKAFGGTQPLSTEGTEQAKALNRRVEMRVLKD
ncbi:MAG: OmpA family protein [Cyclobacteriaceae bacterium]|nr:OmpA family protein [Cyclobacteriaceae bacterium]